MAQSWQGKSLVGQKLGQFEVKAEIARGGMGVVYKGYQPSLDRWVAIKTLPQELAADRDLVMRFQREAEAMVRLNHANIVQIIDRGQDQGQFYFAMEFVEGPSVKDLLKSETIDTDRIFEILCQTCDGLEYAHKKGLVHRDIKPANLLFEEKTGVVKIADFGIAHFSKKDEDMLTLTAKNVGMGTMNYMAPEQKVDAASVDHRADLYAMGVIVYEAFTGKLPLGKFKLPSELNPKLPRELDAVVQKCLEADPKDRYESCAQLKAQLVAARAAVHDRTLKRTMRDALDRTLTAFGPNRAVGVVILSGLLLLVLGGAGGLGLMVLRSSNAKKALEAATRDAEKARADAVALVVEGIDGKALLDEAQSELTAAGQSTGEVQLDHLKRARERFDKATVLAVESRKKRAADLGAQAREARVKLAQAPRGEGLKKKAQAALDEADAQLALGERAFDPRKVAASIDAAHVALNAASELARIDGELRAKLEAADPKDENRKVALAKLEEAARAAESGDPAAVTAALKASAQVAATVTKAPPVVVADPTRTTTPTVDPGATAAAAQKRQEAQDARAAAGKDRNATKELLTLARTVGVDAGVADFEAAGRELEAAETAEPEAAVEKARHARERLKAARVASLSALGALLEKERAGATWAKELAPKEHADAVQGDRFAAAALDDDRIGATARAIAAWRRAVEVAATKADADHRERVKVIEAARAAALLRVLGDATALKTGDDALAEAQVAVQARAFGKAKAALDAADAHFRRADAPCPTKAVRLAEKVTESLRLAKDVGLEQTGGFEVVAACGRSVVVGAGTTLRAFSMPSFGDLGRATTRSPVKALVAAGPGSVFAGLLDGSIERYRVGDAIELDRTVVKHGSLVGALGFDRARELLYAANLPDHTVLCYSSEKGHVARPPIPVPRSGAVSIRAVRTIVPLPDGRVLLHGQTNEGSDDTDKWEFGIASFRYDEKDRTWTREDDFRLKAPSSIAGAGEGVVGIEHADSGRVLTWPSGRVGPEPEPAEGILDAKQMRPRKALRASLYGAYLHVLDLEPESKDTSPLLRRRLFVYKLDR